MHLCLVFKTKRNVKCFLVKTMERVLTHWDHINATVLRVGRTKTAKKVITYYFFTKVIKSKVLPATSN